MVKNNEMMNFSVPKNVYIQFGLFYLMLSFLAGYLWLVGPLWWLISLGVALLLSVATYVVIPFKGFSVRLGPDSLRGPVAYWIWRQTSISLSEIDMKRSQLRSLYAAIDGYWDIYSKKGERIRIYVTVLGASQASELLHKLGISNHEKSIGLIRWAFAWGLILLAMRVIAL